MSTPPSPKPFPNVLATELEAIRSRRQRNQIGSSNSEGDATGSAVPLEAESDLNTDLSQEEVRCAALKDNLVGLAFSGGGIRSATFNLGILQGLADLGLLKYFDYLSTVSGGGYVGSWLAAWIKREGSTENVERQLQSSRLRQSEAERTGLKRGQIFDAEPEPIHHLRAYSNYLTPKLGFFSVDTWVLAAIYLRNLLLNLLVLVPLLLGLVMTERLLTLVFMKTTDTTDSGSWEFAAWVGGQVTLLIMLVVVFLWIHRSIAQIRDSHRGSGTAHNYRLERKYLHVYVMIPLLVLGVVFTWLSRAQFRWITGETFPNVLVLAHIAPFVPISRIWLCRLLAGTAMAIVVGAFHFLSTFDHSDEMVDTHPARSLWTRFGHVSLGTLTGFAGGILLYELFLVIQALEIHGQHGALIALTLGPPLFLSALIFIAFFQDGLVSHYWSESIREWWASVAGTAMIYVFSWFAIFGLSIWGPWLILMLEQKLNGVAAALGAGWITSILSGIIASRGTFVGKSGWARNLLMRVVPIIFLVGLVILASFVTDYFVPVWGFARTPQQYLQSVEQVDIPTDANDPNSDWQIFGATSSLRLSGEMGITILFLFAFTGFVSRRINVNTFSLNALYQNRLVRCYLGASRPKAAHSDGSLINRGAPIHVKNCSPRSPNPITGFDPRDDIPLSKFRSDCSIQTTQQREKLEQLIHEATLKQSELSKTPWWKRGFRRMQIRSEITRLKSQLAKLPIENDYVGPIPILSTALNLVKGGELAWQERMADSFALTPLYCGSKTTGYASTTAYAHGISLGQAVSISGAAVSPNMGYHSSQPLTALLTILNMRLGAWLPNPQSRTWTTPGPRKLLQYIFNELFGLTNADRDYLYLSDGGHFDNLGVYELIRRRCRFIVACDSGADPDFSYQDLAALVRKVRIDFGLRLQIETQFITPASETGFSASHVVVGKICYGDVDHYPNQPASNPSDFEKERRIYCPENNDGLLLYIKPSLTSDEPEDVLNYKTSHPQFPHEPTTEQWFSESQFESYRALGWHIARRVFAPAILENAIDSPSQDDVEKMFQQLFKTWGAAEQPSGETEPSPHPYQERQLVNEPSGPDEDGRMV